MLSNAYCMAIWNERMQQCISETGRSWSDLAKHCGVSRAAVSGWKSGSTQSLDHDNLLKAASFFGVSPDWLAGRSNVKSRVSNLQLVRDEPGDDDVAIPQYQTVDLAAGDGVENDDHQRPSDYVTFKRSWILKKGYNIDELCVVYARGDSMEKRVQHGDVVLIRTDAKDIKDDRVYALLYGREARLKRIRVRANGNIGLISDNDPDGTRSEEISSDTLEQLTIIGQAVWVGGDLS